MAGKHTFVVPADCGAQPKQTSAPPAPGDKP